MTPQKKLLALVIIVIAAFALIFAIEKASLNKAEHDTNGPELVNGLLQEPVQKDGMTYIVPPDRLFEYGVDVPELHEPKYASVSASDEILADNVEGIDIEVAGQHYFYSYQILNWHQIVQVKFDSVKLYVTHDPLTYSDRVYLDGELGGDELELEHANLVYDNNAVYKDKDGNLWSQQRGIQIAGDRTGVKMTMYPYSSMTWGTWKELYPNGQALSTETGYVRDYTRHPFGAYDDNEFIYFPLSTIDTRIADKWVTDGLVNNGYGIGFVRKVILGIGVDNVTVDGAHYVAFYDQELERTRVYIRQLDGGQELTFTYDFGDDEWRDDQTNSVWNADGVAVSGEMSGTELVEVPTTQQFWFSWATQYPQTRIGNQDRLAPPDDGLEEVDIDLTDTE